MYHKGFLVAITIGTLATGCASQHSPSSHAQRAAQPLIVGNYQTLLPAAAHGAKPTWLSPGDQSHHNADRYALTAHGKTAQQAATEAFESALALLHPIDQVSIGFPTTATPKVTALWQNPANKQFHALVTFDRQIAYSHLRATLDGLDARTEQDRQQLNQTREPLARIALLNQVIERQQQRALLQKSLKKIDVTKEGRESPWDTRRWSLELNALLHNLLIAPEIEGDDQASAGLIHPLIEGIVNTGLRRARPFEADYVLSGQLETREQTLESGYIQANGTLRLTLQDSATKRRYGSYDWQLQATSLTAEDAKARLMSKSEQILKQDHRATIIGIATQLQAQR